MCNVYGGFTCADQAIASADAHGDDACVDVAGFETAFNGFTLTVRRPVQCSSRAWGPCCLMWVVDAD